MQSTSPTHGTYWIRVTRSVARTTSMPGRFTASCDTVFISEGQHDALEMVSRWSNRIPPDSRRGDLACLKDADRWMERADAADAFRSVARGGSTESVNAGRSYSPDESG